MTDPPVVFLDANVLFSASLGGEVFGTIRELGRRGVVRLVTSEMCVLEAFDNLRLKQATALPEFDAVLLDVESFAVSDQGMVAWAADAVGAADAHVVAAAMAVGARTVVTGDRSHFGVLMDDPAAPIRVRTPRDFLEEGPEALPR